MKKIFTLTVLVVSAFLVSAQSYRPFPESGHFWNEEHSMLLPGTCGYDYHTCQSPVYFGLDTTINAVVYHRLYYRQICSWQSTMVPPIPPCQFTGTYNVGENLFACIRQDTSLRKVFIYDLGSSQEMLLYDFSLSAGDTLAPSYNNPNYPNVYVTRTDSILLTDGYHKRFVLNVPTLTFGDTISIIEGIGSTAGLVASLVTPFENNDLLRCFANSVQTIYPDTGTACSIALGIPAVDGQPGIELFPNPFQDYVNITNPAMKNGSIRIYQADGRLVLDRTLETGDSRISLPGLADGIYFVVLETDKGRTVQKLIRL